MLQLKVPIKDGILTQGFSQNFNSYYVENGQTGHTGLDYVSYTTDEIRNPVVGESLIYKIINKDNPDLSKYRAVFLLAERDEKHYEISFGHCNNIYCKHGLSKEGELLAQEGNTGNVFIGGREVTSAEKQNGSKKGAHVHMQVRLLQLVDNVSNTGHYITDESGEIQTNGGKFYEIVNYKNGFNGCIDPAQFMGVQEPPKTNHFEYTPEVQKVLDKAPNQAWKDIFLAVLSKLKYSFLKNGSTKP